MEIKFNPRSQFPGRGPCIELVGDWVTEAVWNVVANTLRSNHMDSPAYKARTKATAFFQGGHSDPHGEWILIECWSTEEACAEFLAYLNKEINEVIDKDREVIPVVAKSMNKVDIQKIEDAVALIVDDTGCAMGDENEAAIRKCRSLFKPVDNVQYAKVYFHLLYTFQIEPLFFCK